MRGRGRKESREEGKEGEEEEGGEDGGGEKGEREKGEQRGRGQGRGYGEWEKTGRVESQQEERGGEESEEDGGEGEVGRRVEKYILAKGLTSCSLLMKDRFFSSLSLSLLVRRVTFPARCWYSAVYINMVIPVNIYLYLLQYQEGW